MTRKIKVKVHPGSSQEKIVEKNDSEYEVWIKKRPVEGKANAELTKLLRKHFKCREAKIVSGLSSRNKVVEIVERD